MLGAPASVSAATAPAKIDLTDEGALAPWRDSGHVEIAAGRMRWAMVGQGAPVLVMPKIGGWIGDWRQVAMRLAPRYTVIAIDPPGHGGSTMAGPPPFLLSQEESAAMVAKTMDVLGFPRYAVVGNSMGGSIGLVLSVLWPARVTRLALISTALPKAIPLDTIAASPGNAVFTGEWTYERERQVFGSSRETYEDHVLSMKAAGPWLGPSERGVRRAGLLDYFRRAPVAPLLIYGRRSSGDYQAFLPSLRQQRADFTVVDIAEAGSFTHQDNPDATVAALEPYLAREA